MLLCACLASQITSFAQSNKPSTKSKVPRVFAVCTNASAMADDFSPPSQLLEMLTPTGGVDFGPYIQEMVEKMKRSWCALRPGPDLHGGPVSSTRGSQVVLTFGLSSDGELLTKHPALEQTSDSPELNTVALGAILKAAPFGPLPADFQGKSAKFRVTFMRNMGVIIEDRKNN
jgi:hypothetical protein